MSRYTARILWRCNDPDSFLNNRYTRVHEWQFDGGVTVPASISPHSVRVPYSVEAAVDPEEALVAAASSCHILSFLWVAANGRFKVESYEDNAVGEMTDDAGRKCISTITLDPQIVWAENSPTPEQLAQLHREAHDVGYIANSLRSEVIVKQPDRD